MNATGFAPNRRFAIGFVTAAVAAALSIPFLPLRQSGAVFVLAAVLASRRFTQRRGVALLGVTYAWLWIVACTVAAGRVLPGLLLVAALVCILPKAVDGARAMRGRLLREDVGVIAGGGVLLVWMMGLRSARIDVDPAAWRASAGAVLGCVLAYFAVRGEMSGERPRGVPRVVRWAIVACAVVLLAAGGLWFGSLVAAKVYERRGAPDQALKHARRELAWARRFDVRLAVAHALHRQAELHLAAGRSGAWRTTLRRAVAADPSDFESVQALLHDAINRATFDQANVATEAMLYFAALPPALRPPAYAPHVARYAFVHRNWDIFVEAWRSGGKEEHADIVERIDPFEAGRVLYARGVEGPARRLLAAALAQGRTLRQSTLMLAALHLRAQQRQDVVRLIEERGGDLHSGEEAYLAARADGQRIAEAGVTFADTLRLLHCAPVARNPVAGGHLVLAFRWRLLAPMPSGWNVFVHVRGQGYQAPMFQGDHTFAEAGIDADQWPVGSEVAYRVSVPVPDGRRGRRYTLWVGVWDGERNQPAAYTDEQPAGLRIGANDRVRVAERIRISRRPAP